VVGGDNTLVTPLTTALGTNLTSGGRYTLTSVSTSGKLTELQAAYTAGGGNSINRDALAAWGRDNSISAICLVVDNVKGNDHLFSAQLIDTKDSKLSGKGSHVRTSVGVGDVARVALALAKQLEGPGRRRSTNTPARSYPAELDIEMVFVKGGTFTMGCTAEQTGCEAHEWPMHSVTLSSFSIGRFEITQAQWKAVMTGVAGSTGEDAGEIYSWTGSNCGNSCDDQRPAEHLDWYEAVTFCNELSKKVGLEKAYDISGTTVTLTGKRGYRLPTEAEWEYAARGCEGDGSAGNAVCENLLCSGSNDANEVGWHNANANTTHPVGQKKPNGLGIYDMSGNAWEWVYDWHGSYSSTAANNPTGPDDGSMRVVRSGGYDNKALPWLRVAARNRWYVPTARNGSFGLRVVLPAQ
jgi:formylglycine-generating enzyme required for sulfatase activity